jgi:hypothetical protein
MEAQSLSSAQDTGGAWDTRGVVPSAAAPGAVGARRSISALSESIDGAAGGDGAGAAGVAAADAGAAGATAPAAPAGNPFHATLTAFDLTSIGLGGIIGSGIFVLCALRARSGVRGRGFVCNAALGRHKRGGAILTRSRFRRYPMRR